MRKLISISCLFFAQLVCQTPYANAHSVAPPVAALAMTGPHVAGANSATQVRGTSAYLSAGRGESVGPWQNKFPPSTNTSAALPPPRVFSITAGRTIAANLKQSRAGELVLMWSQVAGAKSYVVQTCRTSQCEPGHAAGAKHALGAESYTDLWTVADTRYVTPRLKRGALHLFRIIAVDAEGRRGLPSIVVAQRVL